MKERLLYEGKAKKIYSLIDDPDTILMEFKDDLTAFNAEKKGEFIDKGSVNRDITSLIFRYLKTKGIKSHWVKDLGKTEMLSLSMEIIPIEVVMRNVLAGSTAKKFQIADGRKLEIPLCEFFYKDDNLGDPFINDEQALMMKAATKDELEELKSQARKINEALIPFFAAVGVTLVDFKLEFGRLKSDKRQILLADEITPDTCRLWTADGEKLDKDIFRKDLGDVKQAYEKVKQLLFTEWESKL